MIAVNNVSTIYEFVIYEIVKVNLKPIFDEKR